MVPVILESPCAGRADANLLYARLAVKDCLRNGEAPFASHLLYTQPHVLDDKKASERQLGIEAGYVWGELAHHVVLYADLGISSGMAQALQFYQGKTPGGTLVRFLPKDLADVWRRDFGKFPND